MEEIQSDKNLYHVAKHSIKITWELVLQMSMWRVSNLTAGVIAQNDCITSMKYVSLDRTEPKRHRDHNQLAVLFPLL